MKPPTSVGVHNYKGFYACGSYRFIFLRLPYLVSFPSKTSLNFLFLVTFNGKTHQTKFKVQPLRKIATKNTPIDKSLPFSPLPALLAFRFSTSKVLPESTRIPPAPACSPPGRQLAAARMDVAEGSKYLLRS